ncbi:DUF4238 domain-containing protein [Roseibium aggregatum]|uniref:DUF4238 domain-containing protein n=1 Tax=Roseibium aggregatum TaxID=187304 RepID=UPI001E2D2180|nr:DUF4238 domain-containing protein [Roseibium aggregatum]UES46523.1 DUF4238 domain-containing protein [Roseibium aggregatum]
MSNSRPKHHHYVPQMLLRRFTDEDGKLHVFDKRRAENGVFCTNPKNVFQERDLNTLENRDGSKDYTLEQDYSELESLVTPIVDKLIDFALGNGALRLSSDERATWDEFFSRQYSRAPDAYNRLGVIDDFDCQWGDAIEEFEQEFAPLSPEVKARLRDPSQLERRLQHVKVKARSTSLTGVLEVLGKKGLMVGVIHDARKSFVIGDHPQIRMGQTGHLVAPSTELWMPISHNVAVTPWGDAGFLAKTRVKQSDVRKLNEQIFRNSNLIASRSPTLIRSIAKLRNNS